MTDGDATFILGIDLGTTYSLCSVLQGGRAVILPNVLGELLTPSAVSLDDDGRMLVGAAARARASTHPAHTALAFKRDMGTDKTVSLGGRKFRPEELSALVLRELKRDAELALGREIHEAVVTVPAYFGDAQRMATRMAGELAGLKVERIINEPTAAALAYGLHQRDRELRAVVLDLGGGTFDVTVLELIEGVIEVQASAGDARLGGEDFADALAGDVERELRETRGLIFDELTHARLRESCERAKCTLSTLDTAQVVLIGARTATGSCDIELPITRERADRVWQPLLERIRTPIARALRDAKLRPDQLDEVLLVGGATRMPCFLELAARIFGRMPSRHLPPDEAVAMGAAVQAALKQGDAAVEDLVATDVAPFSLGVEIVGAFGERQVDGLFSPVIDRGTVIPVSRSKRYYSAVDNQSSMDLSVYQGEHSLTAHNTKLAEFRVGPLPRKPRGEAWIEVRFTYDLNGIIEVEATIEGTGRKHAIVIENRPGALSEGQIEEACAAMARLKFHPRDALPNRTALARADALFVALSGAPRTQLGSYIAAFQAVIDSQDPREIADVRERLIAITESLRRS